MARNGDQVKGAVYGAVFAFLISYLFYHHYTCPYIQWNGGSPLISHPGSCWCGADSYCLCTPSLAIDAIIEVSSSSTSSTSSTFVATASSLDNSPSSDDIYIVLVQRRDSTDVIHAIPGGFVNIDETVEDATIREVKEETNLDILTLEQFRVYSEPTRDARRHTVSAVFRCHIKDIHQIKQGDDAKAVIIAPLIHSLHSFKFAFDHKKILEDYIRFYHPRLASKLT